MQNSADRHIARFDSQFPLAGEVVDGRRVREEVPNEGSIRSSLNEYASLQGIREVPFSAFTQLEPLRYYSATEERRTQKLAQEIKANGEISPLIVVIDDEGPYILEGGHRFDALRELGAQSFPAKVVLDLEGLHIANQKDHGDQYEETGFWGRRGAGCLFLARDTGRLLYAHRSEDVLEPLTYGTWGGAIDAHETPEMAVQGEVREEAGYTGDFELVPLAVFSHESGFQYHNFLAIVDCEFTPQLNWESKGFVWTEHQVVPEPPHPGITYLMEHSASVIAGHVDRVRRERAESIKEKMTDWITQAANGNKKPQPE